MDAGGTPPSTAKSGSPRTVQDGVRSRKAATAAGATPVRSAHLSRASVTAPGPKPGVTIAKLAKTVAAAFVGHAVFASRLAQASQSVSVSTGLSRLDHALTHGTCLPLPCAPAPLFWAQALGRSSEGDQQDLPFCDSTFVDVYEAARALHEQGKPAMPFFTKDATNGITRRFGFEAEFDFLPPIDLEKGLIELDEIAQQLHEQDLVPSGRAGGHRSTKHAGYNTHHGGLEIEPDPPRGRAHVGEWVSPILADDEKSWTRSAQALEIIRRHATWVNDRTGLHVHIGVADYQGRLDALMNLLSLVFKYEDVLYRVGATEHTGPAKPRPLTYRHPNRPPARPYASVDEFLRDQTKNRRVVMNFQAVKQTSSDHVEARIPNSSLQPEVIQTHILLYLQLVEKALQAADGATQLDLTRRESLGAHHDPQGQAEPADLQRFLADTASFREMLDELFDSNLDKARMTALFAITAWQAQDDPMWKKLAPAAIVAALAAAVALLPRMAGRVGDGAPPGEQPTAQPTALSAEPPNVSRRVTRSMTRNDPNLVLSPGLPPKRRTRRAE